MAKAPSQLTYTFRTTIQETYASPHASDSVVLARVHGGRRAYMVVHAAPDGRITATVDDQLDDYETAKSVFDKAVAARP